MKNSAAWWGVLGVVLFGFERITKYIALRWWNDDAYEVHEYLSFTVTFNKGFMGGVGEEYHYAIILLPVLIVTGGVMGMWYRWYRQSLHITQNAVGLFLIGVGSMSNCVDRLLYHGVVDWIMVHGHTWTFPLFNVADVYIDIGILLFLFAYHVV